MFSLIKGLAPFAVGVKATGEVTKEDFENVLIPALEGVSKAYKGINLLMVFEIQLKNFTAGAWIKDVAVNVKWFLKWNKIAIVCNSQFLDNITNAFDIVAPGEAKTFSLSELKEAKDWICCVD